MDLMSNLPVYRGDMFDWHDGEGWTNTRKLGYSFEPGYVGYSDDLGFVVESHRTGVKKIFVYAGSVFDERGDFDGTKWESCDGIRITIEWNP